MTMEATNRHRGEIEVELDRPRTWRLRWKDIARLESELSRQRGDKVTWMSFRARFQSWTIDDLAVVLWAGLAYEADALTVEQIKEYADYSVVESFLYQFSENLATAMPAHMRKNLQSVSANVAEALSKNSVSETTSALPVSNSA